MKKQVPKSILLVFIILSAFGQARAGQISEPIPHYLPENADRYGEYITNHPELSIDLAVAYVNSGADKDFYSDIEIVTDPGSTLVFCTKNSALPADYVPDKLVAVSGANKLREDAAESFERMRADGSVPRTV